MMRGPHRLLIVTGLAVLLGRAPAAQAEPRSLDMSHGRLNVTLTVDPPHVEFDRTTLLTIRITGPSEIEVTMPELGTRLKGFTLSGMYDQNPSPQGGITTLERHARLTPLVADTYRLAPLIIKYKDHSQSPAASGWFHTRAITFSTTSPFDGDAPDTVTYRPNAKRVYRSWRRILLDVGIGIVVAALLVALLIVAIRKLRYQLRLRRMSPRERALHELDVLLKKALIQAGLYKDFYVELTMIVRRYIERQHAVRAPEQTTYEFLEAVSHDTRFAPSVVDTLKRFLEAADLVKFAAYHPSDDAVDQAVQTAKTYLQEDEKRTESGGARTDTNRTGPIPTNNPQP